MLSTYVINSDGILKSRHRRLRLQASYTYYIAMHECAIDSRVTRVFNVQSIQSNNRRTRFCVIYNHTGSEYIELSLPLKRLNVHTDAVLSSL